MRARKRLLAITNYKIVNFPVLSSLRACNHDRTNVPKSILKPPEFHRQSKPFNAAGALGIQMGVDKSA